MCTNNSCSGEAIRAAPVDVSVPLLRGRNPNPCLSPPLLSFPPLSHRSQARIPPRRTPIAKAHLFGCTGTSARRKQSETRREGSGSFPSLARMGRADGFPPQEGLFGSLCSPQRSLGRFEGFQSYSERVPKFRTGSLRSHQVCISCSLRERCERAYAKARADEDGRTVDVMLILLTYGLDIVTGSVENQACLSKVIKGSARKLLNEIVEFSIKDVGSNSPTMVSGRSLSRPGDLNGHQMFKGQPRPMNQGDWICPKCNFLNFAKNIKCLHCNGEFQERYTMLHVSKGIFHSRKEIRYVKSATS